MIDDADLVERLLDGLPPHLPIAARTIREIADHFAATIPDLTLPRDCHVIDLFYPGEDLGGITCRLDFGPDAGLHEFLVSITHLEFGRRAPMARDIANYQTRRRKRLKRQGIGPVTIDALPAAVSEPEVPPAPPADVRERALKIAALTDAVCAEHLDAEYAALARAAVDALARNDPRALGSGRPESWACGVLYALGRGNFLSDDSFPPSMTLAELCRHCGVSPATGANKGGHVAEVLDIHPLNPDWMLPSLYARSPLRWLVGLDGMIVDARRLPYDLQVAAFEEGLIPWVPADGEPRTATA